jgi:hypothetical protein
MILVILNVRNQNVKSEKTISAVRYL